jgi:hypothetical protein
MPKKLFRVTLSRETVVVAEDQAKAMAAAEAEAEDFYLEADFARELTLDDKGALVGLPDGWELTNVPIGQDDEDQLSIGEVVEEMRAEAAKAKNLELPL